MFDKIMVAYDGSPGAKRALEKACELTQATGGQLWAVAVLEHLPKYAASVGEIEEATMQGQAYLRGLLSQAQELARARGVGLQVDQVAGQPAQALLRYAQSHGFQLIVLGHSGHSHIWGTFLGSTADKVVRHAECSVLVVR